MTEQPERGDAFPDGRSERARLEALRLRWASPGPGGRDAYDELRQHVSRRLRAVLGEDVAPPPRSELNALLDTILLEDKIVLKRAEKLGLLEDVSTDLFGRAASP